MLTLFPKVAKAKFSSVSFSTKGAKYTLELSEIKKAGIRTFPFFDKEKGLHMKNVL